MLQVEDERRNAEQYKDQVCAVSKLMLDNPSYMAETIAYNSTKFPPVQQVVKMLAVLPLIDFYNPFVKGKYSYINNFFVSLVCD